MKELSMEQKAKAYDEAIEKAKGWYRTLINDERQRNLLEEIFPKLKEYGDERIRKTLMFYLRRQKEYASQKTFLGIPIEQIIDWLEKQSEEKPTWSEEDKKMFVNIKACLRNANKDYSREIDWLKSIKPQPKNEWSAKLWEM